MDYLDLMSRLAVAIALGGMIGIERQWRARVAGIRTNALVSGGSALFVILGTSALEQGPITDPTRVAAQVVSGIGFLGAGVILRDGLEIRGLNTAATLWASAAVGCLAGAGAPLLALGGAVGIVAANMALRSVTRWITRGRGAGPGGSGPDRPVSPGHVHYLFEAVTSVKGESHVRAAVLQSLQRPEFVVNAFSVAGDKRDRVVVRAEVSSLGRDVEEILERTMLRVSLDAKVASARWWVHPESDD